jgi:hypothetical protein
LLPEAVVALEAQVSGGRALPPPKQDYDKQASDEACRLLNEHMRQQREENDRPTQATKGISSGMAAKFEQAMEPTSRLPRIHDPN